VCVHSVDGNRAKGRVVLVVLIYRRGGRYVTVGPHTVTWTVTDVFECARSSERSAAEPTVVSSATQVQQRETFDGTPCEPQRCD